MADLSLGLIGAMDRLWFQQIILFPEPFSLHVPKTLKPQQPYSDSTATSKSPSSLAEDTSTVVSCPLTPPVPKNEEKEEEEEEEEEEEVKTRPRRRSHSSSRNRSYSSSPITQKRVRSNNHRHSTSCSSFGGSKPPLQKFMSCRSLKDLELEEVKGFMDLGFIFKKEHLNPRMISVVPGLLRLGFFRTNKQKTEPNIALAADDDDDDDEVEQEEEEEVRGVRRPYLSEAWLITRPDSPLLNLRVPRISAAADMKKHLKFWARTVASVVQQEC